LCARIDVILDAQRRRYHDQSDEGFPPETHPCQGISFGESLDLTGVDVARTRDAWRDRIYLVGAWLGPMIAFAAQRSKSTLDHHSAISFHLRGSETLSQFFNIPPVLGMGTERGR